MCKVSFSTKDLSFSSSPILLSSFDVVFSPFTVSIKVSTADRINSGINHHLVEKQAERIETAMINTEAIGMLLFFIKRIIVSKRVWIIQFSMRGEGHYNYCQNPYIQM